MKVPRPVSIINSNKHKSCEVIHVRADCVMFASCETLVISVFVCIIDLEYPSAHDGGDTKVGGDEVLEEHGDENGVS